MRFFRSVQPPKTSEAVIASGLAEFKRARDVIDEGVKLAEQELKDEQELLTVEQQRFEAVKVESLKAQDKLTTSIHKSKRTLERLGEFLGE